MLGVVHIVQGGWVKSRIDLPNRYCAGDSVVSLTGVFRYCSMARCKASVSRSPLGLVFSVMSLFTVFTPTSALQLLCGNATDDMRCRTPQFFKKVFVAVAENSGPPSNDSTSLMPNVTNVRRSTSHHLQPVLQ